MKFYLDEDLTPVIAAAMRKQGVDAVSAHEVGRTGLGDAEQLTFAAGQGRCLVSADARNFRRLGHDAIEQGRPHAGIVLCPPRIRRRGVASVVRALVEIAGRYPAGLGEYDVLYLERGRATVTRAARCGRHLDDGREQVARSGHLARDRWPAAPPRCRTGRRGLSRQQSG